MINIGPMENNSGIGKILKNPVLLILAILAVIVIIVVLLGALVFCGGAAFCAFLTPINEQVTTPDDVSYPKQVTITASRPDSETLVIANQGGKDASELMYIQVLADGEEIWPDSGEVYNEVGSKAEYPIKTGTKITVIGYFEDGSEKELLKGSY